MDRCKPMYNPLELTGRVRRLSRPAEGRVLLVGGWRDRRRLSRCLRQGPWAGMPVVGFIDAGHPRYSGALGWGRQLAVHPQTDPVPVLGGIDQLDELVDRARATHIVVAVSGRPAKRLRPQLAQLSHPEVAVHWIIDEPGGPAAPARDAEATWTTAWADWALRGERLGKRLFDLIGSTIGLIVLSPLFALVALLILFTSSRPIFYRQVRVGQGGRTFEMLKFRSMRRDAEGETGPIWASDHDSRCTRIGAWLRHTNFDELPQLVNVFRGEMSLVGPRPERPIFVERFREALPDYDLRHTVRGGMTGWCRSTAGAAGRRSASGSSTTSTTFSAGRSGSTFRILVMTVQHVVWGKTSWGSSKRRTDP